METIASLIFFASFVSLVVGLVRPKSLERIFKTSGRGKLAGINLALIFGSMMAVGATAPPVDQTSTSLVESSSSEVEVEDLIESESTPTEGSPEAQNSLLPVELPEDSQVDLKDSNTSIFEAESATTTQVDSTPEPEVEVAPEPDPEPASVPTSTYSQTPTPQAEPGPVSPSCYCGSNSLNCGDFGSHAEAQAYYECCLSQVGYDVHGLDGDDDGSACESL